MSKPHSTLLKVLKPHSTNFATLRTAEGVEAALYQLYIRYVPSSVNLNMAPAPKILHEMKQVWMVLVGETFYGMRNLDPNSRRGILEDKVARVMAASDCVVCMELGSSMGKCDPMRHQFHVDRPPFVAEPLRHVDNNEEDEYDAYDSNGGQWVRAGGHRRCQRQDGRTHEGASGHADDYRIRQEARLQRPPLVIPSTIGLPLQQVPSTRTTATTTTGSTLHTTADVGAYGGHLGRSAPASFSGMLPNLPGIVQTGTSGSVTTTSSGLMSTPRVSVTASFSPIPHLPTPPRVVRQLGPLVWQAQQDQQHGRDFPQQHQQQRQNLAYQQDQFQQGHYQQGHHQQSPMQYQQQDTLTALVVQQQDSLAILRDQMSAMTLQMELDTQLLDMGAAIKIDIL